jgi:TRAP-type transport system periplasmic protein
MWCDNEGGTMHKIELTSVGPVSRRTVLKGVAALASGTVATLVAPAVVQAQQKKRILKPIVAGLNAKVGDPTYESISRIAPILRDKYGVEAEIQVHPSSVLGTDTQQLEAVQMGYIDITSNVTAQFYSFSDAFGFVDLPYAITSWDMFGRMLKSDLWKQQAAKFEAKTPLKVLPGVGAGGFRLLWNNKRPLPTPAAVNGLKFRTTNSPLEIAMIRAWGGNPTPMAWTETYNAVSNGVVDGILVQPIWTYGFNMFEVVKYATEVKSIFAVQFQVMNINTWKSFPPDIQQAFMAAAQDAADEANAMDRGSEESFKAKLKEKKMEIYAPSAAELVQWQKPAEALWETDGKNVDRDVIKQMMALR